MTVGAAVPGPLAVQRAPPRGTWPAQIKRTVDETDVAEGLRKIPQHPAGERIDLFSEQPHVVAAGHQTIKHLPRFHMAALQDVIIDEPEAASQKSAFAFGKPVSGVIGLVAQDEFAVDQQFFLDGAQRSAHPRIGCGKKADERDQQQAGVEPLGAIGLHKAVKIPVETALTDLGMDFVGDLAPPPAGLLECSRSAAHSRRDRMRPRP